MKLVGHVLFICLSITAMDKKLIQQNDKNKRVEEVQTDELQFQFEEDIYPFCDGPKYDGIDQRVINFAQHVRRVHRKMHIDKKSKAQEDEDMECR